MGIYAGQGRKATTVTTKTQIAAVKGRLCGLLIAPTGAVTPTVTLYDNAATDESGAKLIVVKTLSAAPIYMDFGDEGVTFDAGLEVNADSFTTLSITVFSKV